MNTDQLLVQRKQLEAAHNSASKALQQFPKLPSGLTPDVIRDTPEYRSAKAAYDAAFQSLRRFNQQHAKTLRRPTRPTGGRVQGGSR